MPLCLKCEYTSQKRGSMAPCESCPPHCPQCAWDHRQVHQPKGNLITVRTAEQYGCIKRAAVVVDSATRQPFMQMGEKLHPLSAVFGGILAGTRLERDIAAAAA